MQKEEKNPILQITSLCKHYKQGAQNVHAIQDISLTIEKQDVFGIIGFSGAGKSTLIRCIPRLISPSSGSIFFYEKDISLMDSKYLRKYRQKIGMIFQHFNLLTSRTVHSNIAYPLELINMPLEKQNERIEELLKLVGLEHKKNAYPSQLSGGEKQRVGIARALAHDPEILLCDEATSALDPKTTQEILNLLSAINKKLQVTIILITHEMEVIKNICNKVAVLEKGKIIEQGLVSDLFFDPKHTTTKQLLERTSHEIPSEFLQEISPRRKLLKLRFRGSAASEPIISEIVRKFHINANILLGWIDRLQSISIGTLIIELTGNPEDIERSLSYMTEKNIHHEVYRGRL